MSIITSRARERMAAHTIREQLEQALQDKDLDAQIGFLEVLIDEKRKVQNGHARKDGGDGDRDGDRDGDV